MNMLSKFIKQDDLKKEKLSEKDQLVIVASSIVFLFFGLFVFIEKLPFDWVYLLYNFFASNETQWTLFAISPYIVWSSIKERNTGYCLILVAVIGGQYLYVEHFADRYSLQFEEIKVEQKGRQMYFPHWNVG